MRINRGHLFRHLLARKPATIFFFAFGRDSKAGRGVESFIVEKRKATGMV